MDDRGAIAADAYDSPTFGKDVAFHVDKPVGSMSISPCGRDVVLASRQGLHIIDLDSPWTPPRHLSHFTPWEVADVQWSPFASRDYWVVSTSNQKALVWNLAMSTPSASIEHVLHAHTRAITDINFSAHHQDLLATCGVDAFIHCWDLRFPARPAITFCDWFAGATQVKWNRQEGHIIASAHDKVLRIWDDRKGAHPLRSIPAHSTKIYGIDWNRTDAKRLVTCSLDKTIKFWNSENELDEPERTITTAFPVWRARHTPFGQGLLAMPQRNDFNVHLYDRRPERISSPDQYLPSVKQFSGHEDCVKEFLWRSRGSVDYENDRREWQLVTWGSDFSLRLHRMTDADLELVGYKQGDSINTKLHFTRRDAPYKTFREDPGKSSSPHVRSAAPHSQLSDGLDAAFDINRPSLRSIIPSPSTVLGAWMIGGFISSRQGAGNLTTAQKDLDPITWMKGVKIGKREPIADQDLPSIASPNFRMEKSSEEFESLGDEITHVGTKFSRVEFSRVEVKKRYLQLSLHGPWGPKFSMTYLNCRIDFPPEYPQRAHPTVLIERTTTLPDETINHLQQDTQKLGIAFQAYQKPSFEALVRYLQGEQTLEELTAWVKDDPDASVYDFTVGSEGSSSDDEDDLGTFVVKPEGDAVMTGSGVLSVSNANVNVPLARTCGGLWSYSGHLICFFKQKEELSHSLAGSFGFDEYMNLSKSKRRNIDGLGRYYPSSATIRSKTSSIGTLESDDSDSEYTSDSSDMSSSSSWLSNQDLAPKGQHGNLRGPLRPSISPFQGQEKLVEEARLSNASLSGTKSRSGAAKCLVFVYDMTEILPAKQKLAARYNLTGHHASANNAALAKEQGLDDLAEAWLIIGMILRDAMSLRVTSVPIQLTQLNLVYRDPKINTVRAGDGINQALINWGNHPFGKSFLVVQLFSYFASLGDVQMLAAMSCVLNQPISQQNLRRLHPDPRQSTTGSFQYTLAGISPSPPVIPLSALDSFPAVDANGFINQLERPGGLGANVRPKFEPSSLSSSFGAPGSDRMAIYPPAVTPPVSSKFSRRSSDQPETEPFLISSSPERLKWAQRSGSQIASALSSSFQKPFFTASASSSPPGLYSKKKISPIGSLGVNRGVLPGAITARFSRSLSNTDEPRFGEKNARAARTRKSDPPKTRIPSFKIQLKNQDLFFSDANSDPTLPKAGDYHYYETWRRSYADLLLAWGLAVQRAEVLKFNRQLPSKAPIQAFNIQSELEIGKRRTRADPSDMRVAEVEVVQCCNLCAAELQQSEPISLQCRHHHQQQQSRPVAYACLLCDENIYGRAQPCLNCGHIMHTVCWDIATRATLPNKFLCLSGCGCRCGEHLQVTSNRIESLAMSSSRAPSVAATVRDERAGVNGATVGQEAEEMVLWEDVAYESLVKNLGGFNRSGRLSQAKARSSRGRGVGGY